MSGLPLLDLSGLTKPATVLIERVADAVGGMAKPWQVKRLARADAEAEIIRAEARLQITDMEERALRRLVAEEGRKQENIEAITTGALPYLTMDASPEEIANDWLTHFFERSRLTSDSDMQLLWSKILAGSANNPGSFSRRTVDLVATIEKHDADLLMSVANRVLTFRDYGSSDPNSEFTDHMPFVFDVEKHANGLELSFDNLIHLQDIGFINFDNVGNYEFTDIPKSAEFIRDGRVYSVQTNGHLVIGRAMYTKAGREIHNIMNCCCGDAEFEEILRHWMTAGNAVSCKI